MATIIKSNKVATGDFYTNTDYGLAYAEVAEYVDSVTADGNTLTQSEFNALQKLHSDLREIGIMDNVLEIYPFLGSNFGGQLTKSKYARDKKLVGLFGFSQEYNGDGRLGVEWRDYRASGPLALDTKLTDADFSNGLGFATYVNLVSIGAVDNYTTIFGKGVGLLSPNTRAFVRNQGDQLFVSSGTTPSPTVADPVNGVNMLSGFMELQSNAVKNKSAYKNGDLITYADTTEPALAYDPTTYYIAGRNQSNGGTPEQGVEGKMRFFIVTNGNFPMSKHLQLLNACQDFIVGAGKIFV